MSVNVWTAKGRTDETIAAVLARLASLAPTWSWLEPRPGCGLDDTGRPIPELVPDKLHPLLRPANPMPTLDPRLVFDEARLFWPKASLHLLADGTETRWSYWAVETDLPPASRQAIKDLGLVKEASRAFADGGAETVLTRQDFARFGLASPAPGLPKTLQIQTYRTGGTIAAWTIATPGGSLK